MKPKRAVLVLSTIVDYCPPTPQKKKLKFSLGGVSTTKKIFVTFEIFVKTILGKTMTLEVKGNDTVSDLQAMIESKDGQERDDSYLEYPKGRNKLTNSRTLADYNI